ncbi:MAG: hypothetical protein WA966_10225, partial [Ornithinimicrobium sp.]
MRAQARVFALALLLGLFAVLSGGSAAAAVPAQTGDVAIPAHPLGNFTVSHYNGLTLTPDGVQVLTVIDSAEIPTQQDRATIDTDGDDELSAGELAARSADQCPQVQQDLVAEVDGEALVWDVTDARMEAVPGSAGL